MVSTKGQLFVSAGTLLNKALSVHRKKIGEFLHDIRAIDAIKTDHRTFLL